MNLSVAERQNFIKRLHIFRGLNDDQLAEISEKLQEKRFEAGETIVRQGDHGETFFIVYRGQVEVSTGRGRRLKRLGFLTEGDYFGEEALLRRHHRRSASVTARSEGLTLILHRRDFEQLLKQVPALRRNFQVAIDSHRLIRRLRFKWLQANESIYFLARKHTVVLLQALFAPTLALILPILFIIFFFAFPSVIFLDLGSLALTLIAVWMIWKWLDWSNDYYIVTNLRVIRLEKTIGIYDSRQEAPLSTILSVGVETDQVGRILDYGTVIIRTFVGRILFTQVFRPQQAAQMIEEYWSRSRAMARQADVEAMKRAIREKLGLAAPPPPPRQQEPALLPPASRRGLGRALFGNLFSIRIVESGGTITYRKHYFVLFKQTWAPGLTGLTMLVLLGYDWYRNGPNLGVFSLILLLAFFGAFLWWLYQYIDWRNDKFQVTQDQIFDIDRTPFGREERKSASLDNILSTEYKRDTFLKVLLNYGDVYISVGGTQLVFQDVQDPPTVQQDIDQRRVARLEAKRQAEAAAERERMASWLATYHQSAEEFRREQSQQKTDESEVK
ncbi:MAG: cyclic nucleotide-binding domain-containing protein [Anaerolineales bacterium]